MSNDAEVQRWRTLAAKALVQALEMTDPEERAIMLRIATSYEQLARIIEKRRGT